MPAFIHVTFAMSRSRRKTHAASVDVVVHGAARGASRTAFGHAARHAALRSQNGSFVAPGLAFHDKRMAAP
jgi:hypothetical protein